MKLAKPNMNLIISIKIATQIRTIIMPTMINSILFITLFRYGLKHVEKFRYIYYTISDN